MDAAGFRLRAACGIAGPVAFTAAWVTSTLRQTGYSVAEEHLSGLAAPDARDPEILLAGFLALGACTTAFGSALREALGGPGRAPTVECGGTAPEAASGNGVGGRGSRVLRSMQVRTQLLAMLVLPLLALTVLSGARVNTAVTEGQSAEQARALAGFAVQTNLLVTELQQERGQSSDYLASDRRRGRGALAAQREAVGQVLTAFRAAADRLPVADAGPRLRQRLGDALAGLGGLDEQRRAIDDRPLAVDQALRFYTDAIDRLLDLNGQIAVGSNNERLLGQALALVALSRAKEAVAQEGAFMTEVFSAGRFGEGQCIDAAVAAIMAHHRLSSWPGRPCRPSMSEALPGWTRPSPLRQARDLPAGRGLSWPKSTPLRRSQLTMPESVWVHGYTRGGRILKVCVDIHDKEFVRTVTWPS